MVKLTDDEINYLFKFVEKRFVRQYDVQLELVDHLASSIEELMSGPEPLNFRDSLDAVYAGFGILEFDKLVKSRSKAAYQQGRKLWWVKFKSLLKWPEAIVSLIVFGLVYLSIEVFGLFPVSLVVEVFIFWAGLRLITRNGSKKQFAGLAFSSSFIFFSSMFFATLPVQMYRYDGVYPQPIIYCLVIFLQILCFQAFYKVHQELLKGIRKQYSAVFAG